MADTIDRKYIELLNEKCKHTRCNSFLFNFKHIGDKGTTIDVRGVYFSQTETITITIRDHNIAWSSALMPDKDNPKNVKFDNFIQLEGDLWKRNSRYITNIEEIAGEKRYKTRSFFSKVHDIFISKSQSDKPLDQPNSRSEAYSFFLQSITSYSRLEEKDKIHYKGRRRNISKKVTTTNLDKTKSLLGYDTYKKFKENNISSLWSKEKTDKSELIFDIQELQKQALKED